MTKTDMEVRRSQTGWLVIPEGTYYWYTELVGAP